MPTYNFRNDATGETFSESMKYSEIEEYLANNPGISRGIDTPGIINHNLVASKGVKSKPDGAFRDILGNMKKRHPLGSINTW